MTPPSLRASRQFTWTAYDFSVRAKDGLGGNREGILLFIQSARSFHRARVIYAMVMAYMA